MAPCLTAQDAEWCVWWQQGEGAAEQGRGQDSGSARKYGLHPVPVENQRLLDKGVMRSVVRSLGWRCGRQSGENRKVADAMRDPCIQGPLRTL